MANESKKDFNKMLADSRDMPKIQTVTDAATIKRYGGERMLIAPPAAYDALIKRVPAGKLVLASQLREALAKEASADFTDPMTAGIFVQIVAWASYQRATAGNEKDETPYWRVLKAAGELNSKFPEAFDLQKQKLEAEGQSLTQRGRTNIRYAVEDYEPQLVTLDELLNGEN